MSHVARANLTDSFVRTVALAPMMKIGLAGMFERGEHSSGSLQTKNDVCLWGAREMGHIP